MVRRFVENESWQVGVVTAADGQQWWVVRLFENGVVGTIPAVKRPKS